MNLSTYPDGGTKKFSEGEENAISYEEFKKGDKVSYTNDFGRVFNGEVIGFDKLQNPYPDSFFHKNRFVYLNWDCFWYAVKPDRLTLI
jgi:hypothetical protein